MVKLLFVFVVYCFGNCPGSFSAQNYFPGMLPWHQTGNQQGTAWTVNVNDVSNRYMTYGPYVANITSIYARVDFVLSIDNNDHDKVSVVRLEVNDATKQQVLVSRDVIRTDFGYASHQQVFSLFFSNTNCGSLEFRVFYYCCSAITHYETIVRPVEDGAMGDFWYQQSHFQFITEMTFPTQGQANSTAMMNTGNQILVEGGIWYIFYREFGYGPSPSECQKTIYPIARTVVRSSTDQGRNWSAEYPVASPIPNTDSQCAVLDGSAFYDQETNTWHYLGQCIGTGGWNLCHYYFVGKVPFSSSGFVPNPSNPVVRGGQLFSQICAGAGKHCTVGTVDEGTPDIVEKSNGWYYVTFHGYNYNSKRSARGVASTRDFVNWQTSGYRLPNDAIFSSVDCNGWNINWASGGCVGGGEGSIMRSGDYYYQLIEAPDISLGCLTSMGTQNWVLGLLRAPDYFVSGEWQQYINPTIVPWEKVGCALQYHRIFADGNNIFLSYYIIDFPNSKLQLQIFQLVSGKPVLPMVANINI